MYFSSAFLPSLILLSLSITACTPHPSEQSLLDPENTSPESVYYKGLYNLVDDQIQNRANAVSAGLSQSEMSSENGYLCNQKVMTEEGLAKEGMETGPRLHAKIGEMLNGVRCP